MPMKELTIELSQTSKNEDQQVYSKEGRESPIVSVLR